MAFKLSFPLGLLVAIPMSLAACGSAATAPASAPAGTATALARASQAPSTSASSAPAGLVKLTAAHSNPIAETMQLYLAKEAGIFEKNGLDVDIRLIPGGSTAMAALVAGDTPFSHLGGSEALSSAAGGADIVVLAITSPTTSFVLEAANDLKTPADLKGKRFGISTIGSTSDIALHVGLHKLGLDPDKDVSITAVGSTANRLAALLSGQIQGAMELPLDAAKLEKSGFHSMIDLGDLKEPGTGQGVVAQRAYVNAHRDVTQKYVDSIVQAGALAKADRALAIKAIQQYVKDDAANIGPAYDLYMRQTYTPTPLPRPELWNDAISVLGPKNEKLKSYDVNKLVDPSFVQSAIDRGLNK
ncbi:MAG: ABC transporter substrate-binding protein [Chloroflexota bacterium]